MSDEQDLILNNEDPAAFIATTLMFSQLRSAYRVGKALAEKFPTEEAWQAFLKSSVYVETVAEFAACVTDIRDASELGPAYTPEEIQNSVLSHYPRALDAVEEFAILVDVSGEDVLAVLISA